MAYKKRASIATMVGAPPIFRPGNAGWTRLEKAYGSGATFSPTLRKGITRVVKEYIVEGTMELNASQLTEVSRHLDEIRRAAGVLQTSLAAGGISEDGDESEDADLLARYLINKGLKRCLLKERAVEELIELLTDIQVACIWGKKQVTGSDAAEEGYGEGDAWIEFSRRLSDLLNQSGFLTTARQDSDKRVHEEAMSPFVLFVKELQSFLPNRLRKGDNLGALSKRIQRALQGRRTSR